MLQFPCSSDNRIELGWVVGGTHLKSSFIRCYQVFLLNFDTVANRLRCDFTFLIIISSSSSFSSSFKLCNES
ncbi:hypothetical protein RUM44_012253 [Polyplax serrata]|uniref:Uncharacterized protein n=1 Tax=Polyplax serrata TaxID=468196 RepID=A0ABR1BF00_POLSC